MGCPHPARGVRSTHPGGGAVVPSDPWGDRTAVGSERDASGQQRALARRLLSSGDLRLAGRALCDAKRRHRQSGRAPPSVVESSSRPTAPHRRVRPEQARRRPGCVVASAAGAGARSDGSRHAVSAPRAGLTSRWTLDLPATGFGRLNARVCGDVRGSVTRREAKTNTRL